MSGARRHNICKLYLLLLYIVVRNMLTDNIQIAQLAFHRVRVYLAHVPSFIGLSHLLDVYMPRPMVRVWHSDPVVFRDHVVVDGQYGLRVNPKPSHLYRKTNENFNVEQQQLQKKMCAHGIEKCLEKIVGNMLKKKKSISHNWRDRPGVSDIFGII